MAELVDREVIQVPDPSLLHVVPPGLRRHTRRHLAAGQVSQAVEDVDHRQLEDRASDTPARTSFAGAAFGVPGRGRLLAGRRDERLRRARREGERRSLRLRIELKRLSRRCPAAAGQRQHDRSDPALGSAQCGHVHPAISGRSMPCSCAFFISSFMRGRGAQLRHPIDHIDDQVEAGSGYATASPADAHHFHRQRLVQDPGKLLRVCGQVDECARQLGDQAFEGEPVVQRGYSSDPLRLTAVTPSTTKAPLKAESRGAAALHSACPPAGAGARLSCGQRVIDRPASRVSVTGGHGGPRVRLRPQQG